LYHCAYYMGGTICASFTDKDTHVLLAITFCDSFLSESVTHFNGV